jgi:signal transduction histidine kinase
VYGLSISVILKRFGSLTRTFISTVAIVLNAVLDTLFFGESLGALELTTFLTIFAAIFLFTILGSDARRLSFHLFLYISTLKVLFLFFFRSFCTLPPSPSLHSALTRASLLPGDEWDKKEKAGAEEEEKAVRSLKERYSEEEEEEQAKATLLPKQMPKHT